MLNGTYLTEATPDGLVTLIGGAVEFPPGSEVSRIELLQSAEGDLDGDEKPDGAAVLTENAGNNATIFRLHALLSDGKTAEDVATRMLGDRIVLRSLTIEDGIITAHLLVRGQRDPMTVAPNEPVAIRFALTRDGLLPIDPPSVVGESGAGAAARTLTTAPTLTSHEWELVGIEMGDWTMGLPGLEKLPSLRFKVEPDALQGAGGRVYGFAGCNQMFGSYAAGEGGSLRIRGIALTRRSCRGDEQDMEERVVASLLAARTFEIADGRLTIGFDGGVLRLRADGELANEPLDVDVDDARPAPAESQARDPSRPSA